MPPIWVRAAGPLFARLPAHPEGSGVDPLYPACPPACPHHAAAMLVVPCRTCSCLCRGLKVDSSLTKVLLKSCKLVKPPKPLVSGSCQGKASLGLKSVQQSHSVLKNSSCQSIVVGLHLLHTNNSTSDVFALQYKTIGNIKVLALLNANCHHSNLGTQHSARVTHKAERPVL